MRDGRIALRCRPEEAGVARSDSRAKDLCTFSLTDPAAGVKPGRAPCADVTVAEVVLTHVL
jgi:hypothetical protein